MEELLDKQSVDAESKKVIDEFWSSKQRQSNRIHEISYRACFKPNLVKYFVDKYSANGDFVYDPFGGRGTTAIEATLMGRVPVSNDINPLSKILTEPRLNPPTIEQITDRLEHIFSSCSVDNQLNDLHMFYDDNTFKEISRLKNYLHHSRQVKKEDIIDKWIRMVATNRLTGHSKGFFSVYTLPPNQATSKKRQIAINKSRNQKPDYRNTKELIIKKSKSLLSGIEPFRSKLNSVSKNAILLSNPADDTKEIDSNSIALVVTSPPFMDIVNYVQDNWLRCWFNNIDIAQVKAKITNSKSLIDWENSMRAVLMELKRVLKKGGKIAFEVGEIKNGKINLDESIVKLSAEIGLKHHTTLINTQDFTKTSNIWGIKNNSFGTNTNRVVVLEK